MYYEIRAESGLNEVDLREFYQSRQSLLYTFPRSFRMTRSVLLPLLELLSSFLKRVAVTSVKSRLSVSVNNE
jgi:hypothetical protein